MQSFRLSNGRQWTFRVTMNTLITVQAQTGVNPMVLFHKAGFAGLAEEMPSIVSLAYHGADESARRDLTFAEFADLIFEESSEELERAAMHALLDYLPKKKREALLPAVKEIELNEAKMEAAGLQAATDLPELIRQAADEKIAAMKKRMQRPPSNDAGNSTGN